MLRQLLAGGVSGGIATLPMSGVIWGAKRLGLYHSNPAPETLATRATHRLTGKRVRSRSGRQALTAVSHVGFGTGAGALYGATAQLRPPSPWTGILFGLALWLVNYKGWIPALGLMPPPDGDEQGRTLTMATAHAVYGAALGLVDSRLLPARASHQSG